MRRRDTTTVRRSTATARPALASGLVAFAVFSILFVGWVAIAPPASAPPTTSAGNPPTNIAPCSSTWLVSINCAREDEGIAPLPVHLPALEAMSVPEQLFVLTDYERVDRGLPPFSAMTSPLDATAANGADHGGDPPLDAINSSSWGGAVWSGGIPSALGTMYGWMYEDGYAPARHVNLGCEKQGDSGCWSHRNDILHPAIRCSSGRSPSLTLGAAANRSVAHGSIAMTLLISCGGSPRQVTYTWAQAQVQADSEAKPKAKA